MFVFGIGDLSSGLSGLPPPGLRLLKAIAFAIQFQNMNMMGQTIEQGAG